MYKRIIAGFLYLILVFNAITTVAQYEQNYIAKYLRDLNSIGTTYNDAVDLSKAYKNDSAYVLMNSLCDSLEQHKLWESLLLARNELATMYIQHDKYETAIEYLKQTDSICKNHIDTLSTEYIYTCKLVWFGYYYLEDYDNLKLIQDYRYDLVKIRTPDNMANSAHYALDIDTYDEISISYKIMGNYRRFYECKEMAFQLAEKINWQYKINQLNGNFGSALASFGKTEYALDFALQAFNTNTLEYYYDTMFAVSQTQILASIYRDLNNYTKSKVYISKCLYFIANNAHPFHYEHPAALNFFGKIYMDQNQKDSAEFYYNEAIKIANQSKAYPYLISANINLADLYKTKQGYEDTVPYFLDNMRQVVEDYDIGKLNTLIAYYQYFSQHYLAEGNNAEALKYIDYAINTALGKPITDTISTIIDVPKEKSTNDVFELNQLKIDVLIASSKEDPKFYDLDLIKRQYDQVEKIASVLINENTSKKSVEEVLIKYSETVDVIVSFYMSKSSLSIIQEKNLHAIISNSKGVSLLNDIYHARYAALLEGSDTTFSHLKSLKNSIFTLENERDLFDNRNEIDSAKAITDTLVVLRRKAIIIDAQLKFMAQENADAFFSNQLVDISTVQGYLDSDDVLIEYYVSGQNALAYCLTNVDFKIARLDKELLNFQTSKMIRGLKTGDYKRDDVEKLYESLIEPFDSLINNKKDLHIIPQQDLNYLPFELLIDRSGDFLVNNYCIIYNISSNLWINAHGVDNQSINTDFSLLGIAPVFNNENGVLASSTTLRSDYEEDSLVFRDVCNFKSLPNTAIELEQINNIFNKNNYYNTVLLTNNKATKHDFINELPDKRVIHIATHGLVNKRNPYLSGFALAPVDKYFTRADIFYHYELYNKELSADLVVLSACKTGTGKIVAGEGVMALPRGFIFAGVPNVIASLWKVHDEKTKDLMVAFYKHLLEDKVSYAEALRLAKLDCIEKGFLPIDWAGFVLIGN